MTMTLIALAVGILLLYFGAELLVRGSSNLALRFGISALTVGLTVVAFGTSAPELVVSINAGLDSQPDIAVGNIVGSNIFNILAIIGISGTITPLKVKEVGMVDLGFMLGTALFLLPFMRSGFRINRMEGMVLILIYGGYLWYLWPK